MTPFSTSYYVRNFLSFQPQSKLSTCFAFACPTATRLYASTPFANGTMSIGGGLKTPVLGGDEWLEADARSGKIPAWDSRQSCVLEASRDVRDAAGADRRSNHVNDCFPLARLWNRDLCDSQ